jgi:hypothetical protein
MTYELIQSALTCATEVIAITGLTGIITHAFWTSHKNWMTEHCPPIPHATAAPEIKPEVTTPAPQPEVVQEENESLEELFRKAEEIFAKSICQESEEVTQPTPPAEAVNKPVTPCKPRSKENPRAMSLGAASTDYAVMSSQQLRRECAARGVNWRVGGDYGRPMKKSQMLAALK